MPEGDTIHRAAARLAPALVGREIVRFEAQRVPPPWPKPGVVVVGAEARGKHLLVHFDDGWTLQTHMRMTGSWHLYRPGERWRKPRHLVRALVEVGSAADGADPEGWVAVCFSAPVVQLVREPRTLHLGPDLCTPDADLDEAVRRMGAIDPSTLVVDVLLDQRICCGVGNVYKSEVLFALRLHPLTPIGAVEPAERRRMVETAARQLRANLTTSSRTTVAGPPGTLAVYGRQREPCRRCGTPIAWSRTGSQARGTYWCPQCQPGPRVGAASPHS
ncbi:MAG TPA: DNA-formamidopyrimidine glycosylase family protein [Acidimicrobiales bacterium]